MYNFPDKTFKSVYEGSSYKSNEVKKIVEYFQSQEYLIFKELKSGTNRAKEIQLTIEKHIIEGLLIWIQSNI